MVTLAIAVSLLLCSSVESFSAQPKPRIAPPQEQQQVHDPFGPPPLVSHLQVGGNPLSTQQSISDSSAQKYISDSTTQQSISHPRIHRLSHSPHIFLLKSAVPTEHCAPIIDQAVNNMKPAETTEGDGKVLRRNCRVAWLGNDQPMIKTLGQTTGNLLLSDQVKMSPGSGCEELQVLNYFEEGGEFVLHHDGMGRVITVIYYLNGVAGTWFPLADRLLGGGDSPIPTNRDEALELIEDCVPGRDGLLVVGKSSPLLAEADPGKVIVVEAGDAVAFYNYYSHSNDGEAADWRSLHTGLPTTAEEGEKWIANHWMHAPALFQNVKTHYSK